MQRNTLFAVACVVGILAISAIGIILGITLSQKEPDLPDPGNSENSDSISNIIKLINSKKNDTIEKIRYRSTYFFIQDFYVKRANFV